MQVLKCYRGKGKTTFCGFMGESYRQIRQILAQVLALSNHRVGYGGVWAASGGNAGLKNV